MNSKDLFNAIKSIQIKLIDAQNKQNEFLNKINNMKIGRKTLQQQKIINNLDKFYNSREQLLIFFKDYTEMLFDANYEAKKMKLKEQGLKY